MKNYATNIQHKDNNILQNSHNVQSSTIGGYKSEKNTNYSGYNNAKQNYYQDTLDLKRAIYSKSKKEKIRNRNLSSRSNNINYSTDAYNRYLGASKQKSKDNTLYSNRMKQSSNLKKAITTGYDTNKSNSNLLNNQSTNQTISSKHLKKSRYNSADKYKNNYNYNGGRIRNFFVKEIDNNTLSGANMSNKLNKFDEILLKSNLKKSDLLIKPKLKGHIIPDYYFPPQQINININNYNFNNYNSKSSICDKLKNSVGNTNNIVNNYVNANNISNSNNDYFSSSNNDLPQNNLGSLNNKGVESSTNFMNVHNSSKSPRFTEINILNEINKNKNKDKKFNENAVINNKIKINKNLQQKVKEINIQKQSIGKNNLLDVIII